MIQQPLNRRPLSRGLSLVELMVGIAVGLFVVAAAVTLVTSQLTENRKLLLELQLQQDLRATMDIMTRQLRRAGAADPNGAQARIAADGVGGIKAGTTLGAVALVATDKVGFSFVRNAADFGPYGFMLSADGVVKTQLSTMSPQDLTDKNTMKVTRLVFGPRNIVGAQPLPCPNLCPDGTTACWPRMHVQHLVLTIEAEARTEPTIKRTMSSEVRVRNDWITDTGDALVTPTTRVCP